MRRRSRKSQQIVSNFDIENFAPKELIEKFSLWMLRTIFKLNTIDQLIDKDGDFKEETIAYFLGLEEFINQEEINRKEVIYFLKNKLNKLEKRKRFTTSNVLKENLVNISTLTQLNVNEIKVLEFSILLDQYDILDDCFRFKGTNLNKSQSKRAISAILDIPSNEIEKIFSSKSKLSKSALVTLDSKYSSSIKDNLDFISDTFTDNMLNCKHDMETILKEIIYKCEVSNLRLNDFEYINKELDVLIPYLKNSIKTSKKGVNILLYGVPGTGKTELSKAISNELKTSLYEISYCDEDDEPIEGVKRLKAFKFAQSLLSNKNAFLMFDEVEDIFNSNNTFDRRQKNKAWINRTLENNTIPTIWITNDVNCIDNAIIRRFDMSIEMPIPSKTKRKNILNKYSQNQISENLISSLSLNENIAPALVSSASKVISSISKEDKDKAFELVIQNTLKAQGHDYKQIDNSINLPKSYNPSYINSDIDLNSLASGIKDNQNARLCLYGPAGTGKSAYGKYIAKHLDKPILLKKGSDLISMYVGGTEKNIARAFEEANEEKAVLVFDEVDSFLANRENANRSWEVTQVNEMLVQMENFDGIFIATTNLMENLDKASLRRFDLKLEFSFLESEQSWELFKVECKNIDIKRVSNKLKEKVTSLRYLTPGDFAAVIRQNRFNPIENANDFVNRLKNEVEVKSIDSSNTMGFIS
jgi:transitional endoplasmic reticulum ATPase